MSPHLTDPLASPHPVNAVNAVPTLTLEATRTAPPRQDSCWRSPTLSFDLFVDLFFLVRPSPWNPTALSWHIILYIGNPKMLTCKLQSQPNNTSLRRISHPPRSSIAPSCVHVSVLSIHHLLCAALSGLILQTPPKGSEYLRDI